MRVLVVEPGPEFSVADVHRGWVRGLGEAGAEVRSLNLADRLDFYERARIEVDGDYRRGVDVDGAITLAAKGIEAACYEWWPDAVVIVSGFFVPRWTLRLMRRRRHKVVLLCTESPYEDDRQVRLAAEVDMAVLNDPVGLDRFRGVNRATHYIPHAHDPTVHHPRGPDPALACDFAFVGTGYPSRARLFEAVDWTGIDARFAGNWQDLVPASPLRPFVERTQEIGHCYANEDAAALYCSASASANVYRREASPNASIEGWAMGPREVELAACGTFFLTEPRGENREVLGMVPTFDGAEDLGAKLRWWLARPAARAAVAAQARAAVADRTFGANARRLLDLLDRL